MFLIVKPIVESWPTCQTLPMFLLFSHTINQTNKEVNEIIKVTDVDGDGLVNYKEFFNIMCKGWGFICDWKGNGGEMNGWTLCYFN